MTFNSIILKLTNISSILHTRLYPAFNRFFFKLKGISYGENFTIMGKVSVVGRGMISIGDNFYMSSGNHVNPISANLQGAFFMGSPNARITIGNNVGLSGTRMWVHESLTIGDNVKIGGGVLIIDTDSHPIDYKTRRISNEGMKFAPIVIEDDAWIGAQSIILKGVTIGARSIIGAGSVVTKSIPADCIATGNPCKVIRFINN